MATKAEQEKTEDMVSAIVARGRTVVTPHPTETFFVRFDEAGKPVHAPVQVHNAPGKKLSLPRSEFNNLLTLGFVIDPSDEFAVNGLRATGLMIH